MGSNPAIPTNFFPLLLLLRTRCFCLLLVCVLAATATDARASEEDERPSPLASIARQVVSDPTTFMPGALLYVSMQLDWNSSQPFFQNGFVERNARYTRSGVSGDVPISYGDGNRKLVVDALAVVPASLANNAVNRATERILSVRFPSKEKLWTTIAYVERAVFASYASYVVSGPHFRRWRANERLAGQLGY